MNINPKTGKPWINNYLQMYGTLFSNQTHKYIQLDRYYDLVGQVEGKTKAAYAMILHSHIAQVTCNRSPGVHFNIFMYIDSEKGTISNSTEMKEWLERTGWMNCNGKHLLAIASHEVWWVVYKCMLDVGLIKAQAGALRAMIPIQGRFLPIPYATVAFLSRIKKDGELGSEIQQALLSIPSKVKANLENLPKEDLIDELVKLKTQHVNPNRNSEIFKMIVEEVQDKYPHTWGNNPVKNVQKKSEKNSKKNVKNFSEKNPENFFENILEINPEKIIEEKIQKDSEKKSTIKSKELQPEEMHNFESNKKTRKKRPKQNPKSNSIVSPEKESEPTEIQTLVFYADDVSAKQADAITETVEKITEKIPEENDVTVFENVLEVPDEEDIQDLPEQEYDIFGLPKFDSDPGDVPQIPENIIPEAVKDEFWDFE